MPGQDQKERLLQGEVVHISSSDAEIEATLRQLQGEIGGTSDSTIVQGETYPPITESRLIETKPASQTADAKTTNIRQLTPRHSALGLILREQRMKIRTA